MKSNRSVKLDELFNPGKSFIKQTFGAAKGWDSYQSSDDILLLGLVTSVNLNIFGSASSLIPPASIKAKLINYDFSKTGNSTNDPWYPPLLPINFLVLPEVGEEVWLIKQVTGAGSNIFWIGKKNNTNYINKFLAGNDKSKALSVNERVGINVDPEKIQIDATQTKTNITSVPLKHGDIVMQGRTDSYIRHSFSDENKEGILEVGIKKRQPLALKNDIINDIYTRTVYAANSTIGLLSELKSLSGSNVNSSVMMNQADVIANISLLENSNPQLENLVLGNSQVAWLVKTLNILKQMILIINLNINNYYNHKHIVPGLTLSKTITISTGEESSETFTVDFEIPDRETLPTVVDQFTKNLLIQSSDNFAKTIETLLDDTDSFLSKNQFIN